MPQRRSSSVQSFISSLHFSGKVIMASVLFGFGLLLVGAILLIIATGGQKTPALTENPDEKKSPMIYVGPGVMGVGAFFVIVGTIMCLLETRILRRRRYTESDGLVNSEIIPAGDSTPPLGKGTSGRLEAGAVNSPDEMQETQVKAVEVDFHAENTQEKVENNSETDHIVKEEERDEKERSTSMEKDQLAAFNTSVYVDAVEHNGDLGDNDDDELFVIKSNCFSTPPEGKLETESGEPFDGGIINSLPAESDPISLHMPTTPGADDADLLKENSLPAESDSTPLHMPTTPSADDADLVKEIVPEPPTSTIVDSVDSVPEDGNQTASVLSTESDETVLECTEDPPADVTSVSSANDVGGSDT